MSDPRPTGMFPDEPMERCTDCGHWSYLAVYMGRCYECARGMASDTSVNPAPIGRKEPPHADVR